MNRMNWMEKPASPNILALSTLSSPVQFPSAGSGAYSASQAKRARNILSLARAEAQKLGVRLPIVTSAAQGRGRMDGAEGGIHSASSVHSAVHSERMLFRLHE